MRGSDAPPLSALDDYSISDDVASTVSARISEDSDRSSSWSDYLGAPAMMVSSLGDARRLALELLDPAPAGVIDVFATSSGNLVDFIRASGHPTRFVGLNVGMQPVVRGTERSWLEAIPGFVPSPNGRAVLEFPGQVPCAGAARGLPETCVAAIWDLALSPGDQGGGALLVVGPAARMPERVRHLVQEGANVERELDASRSARARCRDLGRRQTDALGRVRAGVVSAAGLAEAAVPQIDAAGSAPIWVPVRRPVSVDPATFFSYVRREGTGALWLVLERPLHFAAVQSLGGRRAQRTVLSLAEWTLLPVGPGDSAADAAQRVLAVAKTVHYFQTRRMDDPIRG